MYVYVYLWPRVEAVCRYRVRVCVYVYSARLPHAGRMNVGRFVLYRLKNLRIRRAVDQKLILLKFYCLYLALNIVLSFLLSIGYLELNISSTTGDRVIRELCLLPRVPAAAAICQHGSVRYVPRSRPYPCYPFEKKTNGFRFASGEKNYPS